MSNPTAPMTKRQLIDALEALDVPDNAPVFLSDNEWQDCELAHVAAAPDGSITLYWANGHYESDGHGG